MKRKNTLRICLLLLFIIYPVIISAGEESKYQDTGVLQENGLRVYIDYSKSDNTERFFRREISFVTYVRDPNLAQVHIFITRQTTGSGGRRYQISFIGKEKYANQDQKLFYFSEQSETDIVRREGLTRIIKMGLMPYVSQTSVAEQIEIHYNDLEVKSAPELLSDSWDYWIFELSLGGVTSAEESVKGYSIRSSASADRVTEDWKINNSFFLNYREEKFSQGEENLISTWKWWKIESKVVRSLTERWSAGIAGEIYSSSYRNIRLGMRIAPGIEYNIFPWHEAERRKFSFGYRIGYSQFEYMQLTVYSKFRQNLLFQALDMELELSQPWGEIDLEVEGRQYPEYKDFYSVQIDLEVDIRLSSAWGIVFDTRLESIHDQIYLPKGDATIDEVLLRRRQLATTYDFRFGFGLRYTFGSIYNNIINERM